MASKPSEPVIEGWFTGGDQPSLIGTRCTKCDRHFFPKQSSPCGELDCAEENFEETELSRTGRLWSYTENRYPPPEPYVAADPFVPYTVAAVELDREKMVILGQTSDDTDTTRLEAGTPMELVVGTLYEDDDKQYTVWKWRAVAD